MIKVFWENYLNILQKKSNMESFIEDSFSTTINVPVIKEEYCEKFEGRSLEITLTILTLMTFKYFKSYTFPGYQYNKNIA